MTKTLPYSIHQRTPTLSVLDNRGQAIRSIAYQREQSAGPIDERISRTTYTALGTVDTQTDARFFTEHPSTASAINNFRYGSSLSGKVLHTASVDAGEVEILFDIESRPCWSTDSRTTTTQYEYDTLGRPTTVIEQHDNYVAVTERLIYADTATASSSQNLAVSDGHNALGQLIYHLDPAGVVKTDSFSLAGKPLAQTRQLLANDDIQVNWPAFKNLEELQEVLPTPYYRTQWRQNATGEMVAQWDAKGNRQRLSYTVAGQLNSSYLTPFKQASEQTIVSRIRYSAAGQIFEETAGNGTVTAYTYETKTQRLIQLKSTRPSKTGRPTVLQDLRYGYDPVGNIVTITDTAQQTQYFANQEVSAQQQYTYDTLYQLITATGREDANAGLQTQALPPLKTPLPQAAEGQLAAYTRFYQYDRGGNLIQIQHKGVRSYTKTIEISERSNRAAFVSTQADGHHLQKTAQPFDPRGNLLALSTGQTLRWNPRNQLAQATVINRSDSGANDEERYLYSSDGMRISKTMAAQRKNDLGRDSTIYLPGLELRTQNNGKEELNVILIGEAGRCQVRVLHWEKEKPESIENDQLRYSLDDQIGSSLIELDANADKLSEEVYYPYGGTALWVAKSKIEAKYKYVRYSGKERDATGLYYYGYRYYMPWIGRWLNPDPAGIVDGCNLFRFVCNSPMTLYDGDGLRPKAHKVARNKLSNAYSELRRIHKSAKNMKKNLQSSAKVIAGKAALNVGSGAVVLGVGVSFGVLTSAVGSFSGWALASAGMTVVYVAEAVERDRVGKVAELVTDRFMNNDLSTSLYNPEANAARKAQQNAEWRERHTVVARGVDVVDSIFGESAHENVGKWVDKGVTAFIGAHNTPFGLGDVVAVADHRNVVVKNMENASNLIYEKPSVAKQAIEDMESLFRQVNDLEEAALNAFGDLGEFDKLIAGKNKKDNPLIKGPFEMVSEKKMPSLADIKKTGQKARNNLISLHQVCQEISYPLGYKPGIPKAAYPG